jgi:WS/DGAT/MGAT family acyltransferase
MQVARAVRIERIGPGDLMELASDVGPVPMNVGAVLVLDTGVGSVADPPVLEALLAERIGRIPRLRQRLLDVPWGFGRPVWVDDPAFDVRAHLERVRCADPGDRAALMAVAVGTVTRPLPRSRPLWRAALVTGPAGGGVALVVVVHHVLADGIGGLALLARLVDGSGGGSSPPLHPMPSRAQLFTDAVSTRLTSVRGITHLPAGVRAAVAELGAGRPSAAPRCSLNAPTGPRRQVATVQVELARIRDLARRCGATVNDVLLTATASALAELLRRRGESVPALVISVPVSARVSTTSGELGNRVGVMPIRVPLAGGPRARLAEVAAITRVQKTVTRGGSAALVGPVFRLLAALRLFRWLVDRQRLVNAFLTNLAGPARPLSFGGLRVTDLIPVTITAGNVSVAFAALSYAGTLTVSVIVDPDLVPDLAALAAALDGELEALCENRPDPVR